MKQKQNEKIRNCPQNNTQYANQLLFTWRKKSHNQFFMKISIFYTQNETQNNQMINKITKTYLNFKTPKKPNEKKTNDDVANLKIVNYSQNTHTHTQPKSNPTAHHTQKIQWHALGREEQAKYYELARRERQLHMQMYPDWSSRTNASRGKKRKRKQDSNDGGS